MMTKDQPGTTSRTILRAKPRASNWLMPEMTNER